MKKSKINIYALLFLAGVLMLSYGTASAQAEPAKKNELSFYGKVGFYGLDYQYADDAIRNGRLGAGVGLQYSRSLNENWSISTGLEYQQSHSEAILSNFSDHYETTDTEGADFNFYSSADTYSEWERVSMINIPLLFQYEPPSPWATTKIYTSIGFQFGIPVISKYQATAEGLKTSGYFPQWDALLESPGFMGFGSWESVQSHKQKMDIRSSTSLLLEVGFKRQLNEKQYLYFGYYADFGLNQLTKKNRSSSAVIEYDVDNPMDFKFNPLFYSAPQAQGETYLTKPKIQGFGIKIRYAFKL